MSYLGDGETSAAGFLLRRSDDAPSVAFGSGASARFVAPGSTTAGRYGLFRWDAPARSGGARPHFHRTFSEAFYILSGSLEVLSGSQWTTARAGDYLYVPEGGIHAFRNDGDENASMLILFAPGAPRERYFEELAEIARGGRNLTADEWTELYARHDQTMV
jgi:mannose-6-phosphate isomerase-like protein (cupin superfamily)